MSCSLLYTIENMFPKAVKKSAIEIYTRIRRDEVRISLHEKYVKKMNRVPKMDREDEIQETATNGADIDVL